MKHSGLRNYELVCKDIDSNIHELLAYNFNPLLAKVFNKYYDLSKPHNSSRTIETWINEYDGARIQVLYSEDNRSFDEIVVDWLFNLRDMFVEHKINLEVFRRYLADIATYTRGRNNELFTDILKLLDVLGCNIKYEIVKTRPEVGDEGLPEVALPTILLDSRSRNVVRVIIKVVNGKDEPLLGIPVKVTSIIPSGTKQESYTIEVKTDENGTVIIPAYKFSTMTIKAGNESKTITVASKDQMVKLTLSSLIRTPKDYVVVALLSGAVGISIVLLIYLLFH